jgi:CubicO group peptidase (beta-lactamase class C family)
MQMKSLVIAVAAALLATQSTAVAPPDALSPLFAADQGETRGVLVMRGGRVVAKRYGPGYSDANRFISWSMAKSVTAVLVGELVADGKLSLDAPVPFAEWRAPGDPRGEITLRQMLHMSSGLDHSEGLDPRDGAAGVLKSDTTSILFVNGTQDMAARGLAKGMEAKPGTHYEYSSITSLLLAELITRTLTENKDAKTRAKAYTAFANERLFAPAGITSAVFDFDGAGTQIGGSIIYMSLEDWGRFGQVMMGRAGVIAPDWLTFLRNPSATDGGYGGHIWLNRARPKGSDPALFPGTGPDSLYAAIGHLGQFVIVSPEQDLVLVRLGKTNDDVMEPVRLALGRAVEAIDKF